MAAWLGYHLGLDHMQGGFISVQQILHGFSLPILCYTPGATTVYLVFHDTGMVLLCWCLY